jgi:hypothetical protein
MIWAALFFLAFCTVIFGGILLLARGRSRTSITGPIVHTVDYDNPYGRGAFFWTNRHAPPPAPPAAPVADRADTWPGFGPVTTPLTFGAADPPPARQVALPGQVSLDDGYRAAYYLVEQFAALEPDPDGGLAHLLDYLRSHPARRDDWDQAVRQALNGARADDPLGDEAPRRD